MTYTVTITDDSTGEVVWQFGPVDPAQAGSDAENYRDPLNDEPLDDANKVLHVVAPAVCPFDCDHCRE